MMANNLAAVVVASTLLIGLAAGGVAAVPAELPEHAADQATTNASDDNVENAPVDIANASEGPAVDPANASDEAVAERANTSDDDGVARPSQADNAMNQQVALDRPGEVGPPDGLPEQVPDRVTQIHETIQSFLDGTVDHLGAQLSELLGDGDDDAADDEDNGDDE